jgi:radical SAM protein with 4Fe4S-binding SPASM domain
MVVTKLNNKHIIETARFLRDELGVNSISVGRASRPINGVSDFDNYALTLEEFRGMLKDLIYIRDNLGMRVSTLSVYAECSCDSSETYGIFADRKCFAGKTTLAIGYNGDVKACARDSVAYGNLATKTLKECWDAMDDWRTFDVESLPKECHECNARYSCQGGCRLDRINSIPGKVYRDETKLPITFEVNREETPEYEAEDIFVVRKDVKFFEEDFGMKGVNCYRDAFFVTNQLYEFLNTTHEFSMKDFMDHFEVSSEEANYGLQYLVNHNAIKPVY